MPWTQIKANNQWFIPKEFLIAGRTLCDPNRIAEHDLRAYWGHWYKQSKSGNHLTFSAVKPQQGSNNGENGRLAGGTKDVDRSDERSTPEGDQESGHVVPAGCESDEEKCTFIASLCVDEQDYQAVVDLVTQLRVSTWYWSHAPS